MADPAPEGPPAPAQPVPQLGRRAKLTQDALLAASNKVIKVLDEKAMAQCFPTYADKEQRLLVGLREMVVNAFNEAVPLAWSDMVRNANFIEKANTLDIIVADAEARRKRNEDPRNLFATGANGSVTIPNATVPILRNATAELREKRIALAEKNAATYERIARLCTATTSSEAQIQQILQDFQTTIQALETIDQKALEEMQDELVKVVGNEL
ncbi:hypothetical protein JCM1841_000506 [Sporobolomyces salmonicolor]